MTVPASTAPQCAPSARLAWGREGRGGERKRGVGHPLYSVPVLFGFPSSDGAFLALAAPGCAWRWLGGRCACACLCVECEVLSWCPGPAAGGLVPARWQRADPAAGHWLTPTVLVAAEPPAAELFRRSAVSFPSGLLSSSQPPPGAHLPLSQRCVATCSCFKRAVVAVLCPAAVPRLAKPARPVSLPAHSLGHPGRLSPPPAPGPCLCFGHRAASWAAGTLPARVVPPVFSSKVPEFVGLPGKRFAEEQSLERHGLWRAPSGAGQAAGERVLRQGTFCLREMCHQAAGRR